MRSYNWPNTVYWGCEGASGGDVPILGPERQNPYGSESVCFNDLSLGEEADNAGMSWAFYSAPVGARDGGGWNGYQANQYVCYGSDWTNDVIQNPAQFLSDVSSGTLRQITWITPTLVNSDHPQSMSATGPMWVASVVNAIGKSKFWKSTAIFVFWDDPSGFYDPEPPSLRRLRRTRVPASALDHFSVCEERLRFSRAIRARQLLKFAEDVFDLGWLSASDTRANLPAQIVSISISRHVSSKQFRARLGSTTSSIRNSIRAR